MNRQRSQVEFSGFMAYCEIYASLPNGGKANVIRQIIAEGSEDNNWQWSPLICIDTNKLHCQNRIIGIALDNVIIHKYSQSQLESIVLNISESNDRLGTLVSTIMMHNLISRHQQC